jgi:hypothetical protein
MSDTKNKTDLEDVLEGFFLRLPTIDPLIKELLENDDSVLKLELVNPRFDIALDFAKTPLEVRPNSDAFGTIGIGAEADVFHELLLGRLEIAKALSHRKLIIRGALSRLMKTTALLLLTPYVYPLYLKSAGREDLISDSGERVRQPPIDPGGWIGKLTLKIMVSVGYLIGVRGASGQSQLDVFKLLEKWSGLLIKLTRLIHKLGAPKLTLLMVLSALGRGINRL